MGKIVLVVNFIIWMSFWFLIWNEVGILFFLVLIVYGLWKLFIGLLLVLRIIIVLLLLSVVFLFFGRFRGK